MKYFLVVDYNKTPPLTVGLCRFDATGKAVVSERFDLASKKWVYEPGVIGGFGFDASTLLEPCGPEVASAFLKKHDKNNSK